MAPSRKEILKNLHKLNPKQQEAVRSLLRKGDEEKKDPHSKGGGVAVPTSNPSTSKPPPPVSYFCRYLELASIEALKDISRCGRWVKWPPEAIAIVRIRLGIDPAVTLDHAPSTTD